MINKQDWTAYKRLLFMQSSGGSASEYTATGNPLSFNTNLARALKGLTIPFTPTQSGTGDPSPTNVRPISGVSAVNVKHLDKNLLVIDRTSGQSANGVVFTRILQNDVCYMVNVKGQRTSSNVFYNLYNTPGTINIQPGQYKVYGYTSNVAIRVFYKDAGGTEKIAFNSASMTGSFTIPSDCTASWIRLQVNTDSYVDETIYPILLASNNETLHTYPITFPALGKNLLNRATEISGSYINDGGYVAYDDGWIASDYVPVQPNTQYTFTPNSTAGSGGKHAFYTENKAFISYISSGQQTFTTPSDCSYVRFSYRIASTDVMLNKGSTAQTYEPYTNTVYGGSLDVTTGVLTVEWAMLDLYEKRSSFNYNSTFNVFIIAPQSVGEAAAKNNFTCLCNSYKYGGAYNKLQDQQIGYIFNNNIAIRDDSFEGNVSDFRDSLEGVVCVYELATEQTVQLTPQQITALLGDNTIWSDTNGSNSAVYFKKG